MGRLAIFNRRVALAPDDVYVPALYALVLHSVWLASTTVVFAVVRHDCGVSAVLTTFLLMLITTLCVQVPLDALMLGLSMSGTVSRKGPRRYVSACVQVSFFVLVWELGLECYGIYVTYGPNNYLSPVETPDCEYRMDSSSPILIHLVVMWSFLAIIFYFLTMAVLLVNSEHKSGSKLDQYIKIWQSRLNYAVGTGGLVDSDVLRDVAGELAIYFKDFDWAPSDVAVGLLLLKREQKKITEVRQARRLLIEQPQGFSIPTLEDQTVRAELAKVQGEEESRRMTFMNSGGRSVKKYFESTAKSLSRRLSVTLDVAKGAGSSSNAIPSPSLVPPSPVAEEGLGPVEPNDSGKSVTSPDSSNKLNVDVSLAEEEKENSRVVKFKSVEDLGAVAVATVAVRTPEYAVPINDDTSDEPSVLVAPSTPAADTGKPKLKGRFSMPTLKSPNFKSPSKSSAMTPRSNKSTSSSQPQLEQFQPFQFRKRRNMGTHRSSRPKIQHGSVLREEIDDILYFARYAEVVYTPAEINMIYSDRLHFHSNDNGIYRSPYLIVHDVDTDSIVIAIRGTYSAADVLVDLKFDVMPLEIPELENPDGDEHLAHSGFLHTANNIVGDIRRLNILGPLLNDPGSEFFGCSLVVTGHSLGAGVAALVANILRYDFPSTCCYAYEPPGCIVSRKAAQHFETFCTSVVMGDDVVSRLSRNTLEMLKLDIARHLANCDEPKWKVFGSVIGDRLCGGSRNSTSARRKGARTSRPGLLHRRTPSGHLLPEDLAKLKRRTNSLRAGKNGEDNPFAEMQLPTPPMYIPGKILHMEKLRRPPLNMNQVVGRQFAKVVGGAKAVGEGLKMGAEGLVDFVFEGAERIKDGVGEIGDMLLDGIDDVLDGAEGIKDKIVGEKQPRNAGGPSGLHDEVVVVPLKDPDMPSSPVADAPAVKKRAGSLGDLFELKSLKSRSSEDLRLRVDNSVEEDMNDRESAEIPADRAASPAGMDKSASKLGKPRGAVTLVVDEMASPRSGRKSRRRRRRQERARSAGNLRSKSAGRDGFMSAAEESGVSSSDEDLGEGVDPELAARPSVLFRGRKSKGKKESGAATDSEVFSDSELADLGGSRFKSKGSLAGKPTLASVLGTGSSAPIFQSKPTSDQATQPGSRFPALSPSQSNNSKLLGHRSVDTLNHRLSSSPTRQRIPVDQIIPSIKPRAHAEAIPSDSITGRVVPVGSTLLTAVPLENPSIDATAQPPFSVADVPISLTAAKSTKNQTTAPDLLQIPEEEHEEAVTIPIAAGAPTRFQDRNPSVMSRDELVLSKPQYPPARLNSSTVATPEGAKVSGKYHYVPRWARREEFQEIIVSRSMIVDHSPFDLLREFQAAPAGSILGVVTRD
ncbi:hypothetical protein HDU98_000385 [Podochytrium sp. JEL0797]|nr:hypothetical protein HDU98_000385 [Podochytrium sp. JEL0797]